MDDLNAVVDEFIEALDEFCAKLDEMVKRTKNTKGDNN